MLKTDWNQKSNLNDSEAPSSPVDKAAGQVFHGELRTEVPVEVNVFSFGSFCA
jgi:hypothetical protein